MTAKRRAIVPLGSRCEALVHTELMVDFTQCAFAGKGMRDDLRGRLRRACTIHLRKEMVVWERYEALPHDA